MALDTTGLFTVLGKYVKTVNTVNAYIAALESNKDAIFVVLEDEGLQDQYVNLPSQFNSFKQSVSSWITTLISDTTGVILDTDYVISELALYNSDIASVLNGIFDYMLDNSITVKSSVVTLGAMDTNLRASENTLTTDLVDKTPILFASRTLDGTNAPATGVQANKRYSGRESQLAKSTTVTAELTSNTTIGSEQARIFGATKAAAPYGVLAESPGQGSTVSNIEASNLVADNFDFTGWTGDDPDSWSMSGTITTDYEDFSGTGVGPLSLKTEGVTATQQITNLSHSKLYFIGALVEFNDIPSTSNNVIGIRLRDLSGTTLYTQQTASADEDGFDFAYGFFVLDEYVDLTDVYVEIEYVDEGGTSDVVNIKKVVVAPAFYFNGLGWAYWVPYHTESDASAVPIGHRTSLAVANNDAGAFQTYFRKAYNFQLPTADSPSIADSLATA